MSRESNTLSSRRTNCLSCLRICLNHIAICCQLPVLDLSIYIYIYRTDRWPTRSFAINLSSRRTSEFKTSSRHLHAQTVLCRRSHVGYRLLCKLHTRHVCTEWHPNSICFRWLWICCIQHAHLIIVLLQYFCSCTSPLLFHAFVVIVYYIIKWKKWNWPHTSITHSDDRQRRPSVDTENG